jgi:hypothetical protein
MLQTRDESLRRYAPPEREQEPPALRASGWGSTNGSASVILLPSADLPGPMTLKIRWSLWGANRQSVPRIIPPESLGRRSRAFSADKRNHDRVFKRSKPFSFSLSGQAWAKPV